MSKREYDIILYGASGFTALFVIRELESYSFNVALAARDATKIPDSKYPKIKCQVDGLDGLCSQTRLLINCAGPYAQCGYAIIQACLQAGTDYIDISGETAFLNDSYRMFNRQAEERGVHVVQACGFDSVPAEISAMHFAKIFDSVKIDSTIYFKNLIINKGTWISLLNSLRNVKARGCPRGNVPHQQKSKLTPKSHRYNPSSRCYDVLFRGSDAHVVKRTAEFYKKMGMCNLSYVAYQNVGSWPCLVFYYFYWLLIMLLSKSPFFYSLMANHPHWFSLGRVRNNGPSEEERNKSGIQMNVLATGVIGDKEERRSLRILLSDPGYKSTAIFVVVCSTLLLERCDSIAPGVLTPGQAFYGSEIIERLKSKGILILEE